MWDDRNRLSALRSIGAVFCFLIALQSSEAMSDVRTLTLVTVADSPDTYSGELILIEAYRKLGISIRIRRFPAERALKLANQGKVDGEVQRIDAIKDLYPNLIQVRPPINVLQAGVFAKSVNFEIKGWRSLSPYRIGLVRGIKFAEASTQGMNRSIVSSYTNLFRMLDKGHVDLVVVPRKNGIFYLNQVGPRGVLELQPPVTSYKLFHYLHRKNIELAPQISMALEDMESSGESDAIRHRVMTKLIEIARSGGQICTQDYACFETGPGGIK